MPHTRHVTKETSHKEVINPQLEWAGWYLRDHFRIKIEVPVDGCDAEPWNGVTDYTPYHENGGVLAMVEAEKTAEAVHLAEAQFAHDMIEVGKFLPLESSRYYQAPRSRIY